MGYVHSCRNTVLLAVLGLSSTVGGEVVFTGTVTPGAPSQVNETTTVVIGPQNSGDPDLDPRGTITVNNGTQWEAGQVLVGAYELALARMTVSGAGTKVSVERSGSPTSPTLGVAQRGSGHLRVDNGAWLAVGSNQTGVGTMTLGPYFSQSAFGPATAEITGEGTLLTIGSQLVMNGVATSKLRITDGAVVRVGTSNTSSEATVAVVGELSVTGEWSELQTGGMMIGSLNSGPTAGVGGTVRVGAGAIVRPYSQSLSGSASIARFGVLEMEGGTFSLPLRQVEGVVRGSGVLTRDVTIIDDGSLEVGAAESLRLDGFLTSRGQVAVEGGRLEIYGDFTNDDVGEYKGAVEINDGEAGFFGRSSNESTMRVVGSEVEFDNRRTSEPFMQTGALYVADSQLTVARSMTNRGVFEFVNSSLKLIEGSLRNEIGSREPGWVILDNSQILAQTPYFNTQISNAGLIQARAGHNVVQPRVTSQGQSSLLVSEGASIAFQDDADFHGGVTLQAGALVEVASSMTIGDTLAIEVGAPNQFQAAIISSSFVYLSGQLHVAMSEVADIALGETLSLITADQIFGEFSQITLPDLPGTLEFVPQLTATELSLLVIDSAVTLPGDYNADGCINAADYTVLRDSEMQEANPMAMVTWQTNYGRWLPGSGMPIPEPTAAVLFAIGLTAIAALRR
jgi:hypothetical protein